MRLNESSLWPGCKQILWSFFSRTSLQHWMFVMPSSGSWSSLPCLNVAWGGHGAVILFGPAASSLPHALLLKGKPRCASACGRCALLLKTAQHLRAPKLIWGFVLFFLPGMNSGEPQKETSNLKDVQVWVIALQVPAQRSVQSLDSPVHWSSALTSTLTWRHGFCAETLAFLSPETWRI